MHSIDVPVSVYNVPYIPIHKEERHWRFNFDAIITRKKLRYGFVPNRHADTPADEGFRLHFHYISIWMHEVRLLFWVRFRNIKTKSATITSLISQQDPMD